MLDFDYPECYAEVVRATNWEIDLPEDWEDFFLETGVAPMNYRDQRQTQRRIVRTCGLLYFEKSLPSLSRDLNPLGIYTRDFSKSACRIISPIELFPEEEVRLILPTFWLQLRVVRVSRHRSNCFEIGMRLLNRNSPSRDAFVLGSRFAGVENH
ncbi:PilZ domain-containing protein [Rhodopirellula bahusiensis]|uniref:PilZ domain-containing protein n=1 Tax=Rhodopirellula bahusiensis TaxID=2014065 RepID=UPI0032668273